MNRFFKYPRTPHLPWSPGASDDDKRLADTAHFSGRTVVVTEKMDGENTSIYRDGLHARSLDGRHHSSRDWVKALQARLSPEIPPGWRLCGENLYARHSIAYDDLESYFYLFSIWTGDNLALSWAETEEWAACWGLPTVPVWRIGLWDEKAMRQLSIETGRQEGYVVRVVDGFSYDDFSVSVAKWVRPSHVGTDGHWMHQAVTPNRLKSHERRPL